MKRRSELIGLLGLAACFLGGLPTVRGQFAAQSTSAIVPAHLQSDLLSNGDFSAATKNPAWPDDWRQKPGVTWEQAKGSHFLRFTVDAPGKTAALFRDLALSPDEGISALKVIVRYRTQGLKLGAKPGQNGRMSFRFYDAVKIAFTPEPTPIVFSPDSSEWTTATATFRVPAGATSLEMFLGLYQVESGVLDLAQVSIKSIAESDVTVPAAVAAEPSRPETPEEQVPIIRDGPRTIIGYGKPSVWFIHPYVDVLGHDFVQGLTHLVMESREQGNPIAVGVAFTLDQVALQDAPNSIYVFTYKNIDYPLPADARRLIFVNTWLTPAVQWPAARAGKKDLVIIGSRMLNNDGDGLATDKARWMQIQKEDPALTLTTLDSTGYYLPIRVWREPILKVILEEKSSR